MTLMGGENFFINNNNNLKLALSDDYID